MRHYALRIAVVGTLVGLFVSSCSSSSKSSTAATTTAPASTAAPTTTAAPTGIVVQTGLNDPTNNHITLNDFMPAQVTVKVGTPITWTWNGTIEPHSVTFLPNNAAPPTPPDEKLFAPSGSAATPYSGTTTVNSGLQPLGPAPAKPLTLSFDKVGTYHYHCVIHPGMVGTVVVTAGTEDTPAQVAARGQGEEKQWETEGEAAAAQLAATVPTSKANANGTTTWTVTMGASTAHTDVMAFAPTPTNVKAGDTVTFVDNSAAPHTATFYNGHPPILDPTSAAAVNPTGPSPATLNTTDLFNSGELPPNAPPGHGPPLAARSYSYVVPAAGTYAYVCVLHASEGMNGSITAT